MSLNWQVAAIAAFAVLCSNASAADAEEMCQAIVANEGAGNDKTDAACACVGEQVGSDADLLANVEEALATPYPARDEIYSEDLLSIIEACGPWE